MVSALQTALNMIPIMTMVEQWTEEMPLVTLPLYMSDVYCTKRIYFSSGWQQACSANCATGCITHDRG